MAQRAAIRALETLSRALPTAFDQRRADLSVITNVTTSAQPYGACSDGINFWVPLYRTHTLLRF